MSDKIVQLNEEVIKGQLKELVRGSVKETLNGLLEAEAEKLYYTALIGYIWYEAPDHEKNFTTLLEMINASEAREDDETFKNPVDKMFDELEARDPDHFAVKQYRNQHRPLPDCQKADWQDHLYRPCPFQRDRQGDDGGQNQAYAP